MSLPSSPETCVAKNITAWRGFMTVVRDLKGLLARPLGLPAFREVKGPGAPQEPAHRGRQGRRDPSERKDHKPAKDRRVSRGARDRRGRREPPGMTAKGA